MAIRGRPAGCMTPLRRRAMAELPAQVATGDRINLTATARKLGIDRQNLKRIIRDLRAMGQLAI